MSTPASYEVTLEGTLQQLEDQLKSDNPDVEGFRLAYQKLIGSSRRLQQLLQWATEWQRGRDNEKQFRALYRQIAGWNASELIETLKKTGFALKQDSHLKDAFDRQGYRMLELVRAGKRDEVFHAILRIFVSFKKEFPVHLVEAFKPIYSDELFKIFLFSFLSGLLGKSQESEE